MVYFYCCMIMFTFGTMVGTVNSCRSFFWVFLSSVIWPVGFVISAIEALKK